MQVYETLTNMYTNMYMYSKQTDKQYSTTDGKLHFPTQHKQSYMYMYDGGMGNYSINLQAEISPIATCTHMNSM